MLSYPSIVNENPALRAAVRQHPRFHELQSNALKPYLTTARNRETDSDGFKRAIKVMAGALWYESSRDIPLKETKIWTPLDVECEGYELRNQSVVAPVLRAGDSMRCIEKYLNNPIISLIGIKRDEETSIARPYLADLPADISEMIVYLVDPMCATGDSLIKAVHLLRTVHVKHVRCLTIIAAPEGANRLLEECPEVELYAVVLDRGLDEKNYIVPGLGDAGDRISGKVWDEENTLVQMLEGINGTEAQLQGK